MREKKRNAHPKNWSECEKITWKERVKLYLPISNSTAHIRSVQSSIVARCKWWFLVYILWDAICDEYRLKLINVCIQWMASDLVFGFGIVLSIPLVFRSFLCWLVIYTIYQVLFVFLDRFVFNSLMIFISYGWKSIKISIYKQINRVFFYHCTWLIKARNECSFGNMQNTKFQDFYVALVFFLFSVTFLCCYFSRFQFCLLSGMNFRFIWCLYSSHTQFQCSLVRSFVSRSICKIHREKKAKR